MRLVPVFTAAGVGNKNALRLPFFHSKGVRLRSLWSTAMTTSMFSSSGKAHAHGFILVRATRAQPKPRGDERESPRTGTGPAERWELFCGTSPANAGKSRRLLNLPSTRFRLWLARSTPTHLRNPWSSMPTETKTFKAVHAHATHLLEKCCWPATYGLACLPDCQRCHGLDEFDGQNKT